MLFSVPLILLFLDFSPNFSGFGAFLCSSWPTQLQDRKAKLSKFWVVGDAGVNLVVNCSLAISIVMSQ